MNTNEINLSPCDLFRKGKFTKCCELLQQSVDNCHLKEITTQDDVEFIVLRNNLLVCNCLRILPAISTEYVGKMTELINISKLYLYEEHIPLELRVNFVCNTLLWYWLKPMEIHDYCYNTIIKLVDECLHKVLQESGKSNVNLSLHVGKEQDILLTLECLSNEFLILEPILVVQCIEISQILLLVFLSQHRSTTSLLIKFTEQLINNIKPIMCAFKYKKLNHITNCFKLGLFKINDFLEIEHVKTFVVSSHVALCINHILKNQHQQALNTLSDINQYLDSDNELFCLVYYLMAIVNFNLEAYDITLYYLSLMSNCSMEPFIKSRCYLLLGRTHSKMGNGDLAIDSFEKLKESTFSKIMAYHMSCHYEQNNMQFTQMLVLEQAIREDCCENNDWYKDFKINYMSKILITLHPQPDLTKRQLLYMAAKKKFEYSSYKLAASAYLSLLKLNESEQYISDLITIPSTFMLGHEAAVALIKAHQMDEAFSLCQSLIGEFEPGCGMWESDSFWANELNGYTFNVVGTMLLAETGFSKNIDIVLEALNKSYNCLYAKIEYHVSETKNSNENIKTLRQILIGKILLLKATVLSKLNKEEDCQAAFEKALTYNAGDEDVVYLYSKWLEHNGQTSQSMNVRDQFDRKNVNTITCDNVVMTYVMENKHGLEDSLINMDVMDDLFASTDENVISKNNEMDSADDDIFNDLFLD